MNTDWDYWQAGKPDEDQFLLQEVSGDGAVVGESELAYEARREGDPPVSVPFRDTALTFGAVTRGYESTYPWIPVELDDLWPRAFIRDGIAWNFEANLPTPRLSPVVPLESLPPPPFELLKVLRDDAAAWIRAQRELSVELMRHLKSYARNIYNLSPDVFEQVVLELLASHGHQVQWIGRRRDIAGDGVVLAMVSPGVEVPMLVEVKLYAESRRVGVQQVTQLFGAMGCEGFPLGLLVTSSHFRSSVTSRFGERLDLNLVDRDGLFEWLRKYVPKIELYWSGARGKER